MSGLPWTRSSKFNDPSLQQARALWPCLRLLGTSAEGPGARLGCVRVSGWSSHNWGGGCARSFPYLEVPTKQKEEKFSVSLFFPTHHLLLSTLLLSPINGQSQSELPGQSSTRRIGLPFCCAVSFAIEPFHFSVGCLSCTTTSSLPSIRFRVHPPSKSPLLAQRTSWSLLAVPRVSITPRRLLMLSTLPSKRSCPPSWPLN